MYIDPDIIGTTRTAVSRHLTGRSIVKITTREAQDEFGNPIVFIYVTLDRFNPTKDAAAYVKIRNHIIEKLSSFAFPIIYLFDKRDARIFAGQA